MHKFRYPESKSHNVPAPLSRHSRNSGICRHHSIQIDSIPDCRSVLKKMKRVGTIQRKASIILNRGSKMTNDFGRNSGMFRFPCNQHGGITPIPDCGWAEIEKERIIHRNASNIFNCGISRLHWNQHGGIVAIPDYGLIKLERKRTIRPIASAASS